MPARRRAVQAVFRGLAITFIAMLLCMPGLPADGAFCGDDVGGVRVPCACGDVVASDTTLRADDPVVTMRCALDGLIVRTPSTAESVTLDLAGLSIVGRGYGAGIRIERGGSDGAAIVGSSNGRRASIVGFGTGISVPTSNALRRLEAVTVKGNRHDGVRMRATGAVVIDVTSSDNGGNGVRMSGGGGRFLRVETHRNAQTGIRVTSRNTIIDAVSEDNGAHGVIVDGRDNDVSRVVSRRNGGVGVVVRGARPVVDGAVAEDNARGGLRRASGGRRR